MKKKHLYLILTVIGFTVPTIFVVIESMETGNILLYAKPLQTLEQMFVNRVSSIFAIDLFITVFVFFIWSYFENKKQSVKNIGFVWLLTLLFGLGGGFPLFLYLREKAKS